MGKQRTEKSKYESRYSPGGYCTAAQYLVEICCENKARLAGKELPYKFWELEEWAKFFRSQIRAANQLIKKYNEKAVIQVLKEQKNKKTFSLRAKWLEPQFIEAHNKILIQEKEIKRATEEKAARESNVVVGTNERPEFKRKNRLNALEEL